MNPSEIHTDSDTVKCIVDEWLSLARRVPGTSYFATPDWVLSWWEYLCPGSRGQVALWRGSSGKAEAVAALSWTADRIHRRFPLRARAWVNMGSGPAAADHCGWPVLDARIPDVTEWLSLRAAEATVVLREMDPLMKPLIPESANRVTVSACPRLEVASNTGAIGASGRFRKQIRYYLRRLENSGVSFRWIPPEEMEESTLTSAFQLHARRRSLKGEDSMFTRDREKFHMSLLARASVGKGPAAVVAESSGRTVGIVYGFVWQNVFSHYQTGWEPEWAQASLGTALVAEAIRLVGEAGIKTYDFLRGGEPYKYRFGASDRTDETWLLPKGSAGQLLKMKYRVRDLRSSNVAAR